MDLFATALLLSVASCYTLTYIYPQQGHLHILLSTMFFSLVQGKPICVLVNKTDLLDPNAEDKQQQQQQVVVPSELQQLLQTRAQNQPHPIAFGQQPAQQQQQQQQQQQVSTTKLQHGMTVMQASALTGAGVQSVLQWLVCELC
jgi:predicted GTPase